MELSHNHKSHYRPEIPLLIHCIRYEMDQKTKDKIKELLFLDIDWSYLISAAEKHCVLPLLSRNLLCDFRGIIPPHINDFLMNWYHYNTIHNKSLVRELKRIDGLFAQNGIIYLPFKGPSSAVYIYNDIALRQFNDLDVIVGEQDYIRAQKTLIENGFIKKNDWEYESGFFNETSKTNIDVHQKIDKPGLACGLKFKHLIKRSEAIFIGDCRLRTLSKEDTLLILCINFAKDLFINKTKLAQINDIANLIAIKSEIDWITLFKIAESSGTKRILYLCLMLANELMDVGLPEEFTKRLGNQTKLKPLVAESRERLMNLLSAKSQFQEYRSEYTDRLSLFLKLKERLRDRIPGYCKLFKKRLVIYSKTYLRKWLVVTS